MRPDNVARRQIIHPIGCPHPCCTQPARRAVIVPLRQQKRAGLVQRFAAAAAPGDWAALAFGLAIGVAFVTVAIVAHNWDAILASVSAL